MAGKPKRTLFAYFRKESTSNQQEENDEAAGDALPHKKACRSFQMKWLTLYPWLHYEENIGMTCDLCMRGGLNNSFTSGNRNFRTSSITDHMRSLDHKRALEIPRLQDNRKAFEKKNRSNQEKAAIVALKAANWLAQEGVALVKFRSLLELLLNVGVEDLKHLNMSANISYDSPYACLEFLKALSDSVEEKNATLIEESPVISLLMDESTDICVNKRLAVYTLTVCPTTMVPLTTFLTNVSLTSGTGLAITEAVKKELSNRGLSEKRIMGLGTDGASVMTGRGVGVTGLMLRENPMMANVHCMAHRLALCTSQAADKLPAVKEYQEVVTSIYYYFKYSTTRNARLKEIQDVLESPKLKFREVHSVRWMSFYSALEALYRSLDALLCFLSEAQDAKAQGIKKKSWEIAEYSNKHQAFTQVGSVKFVSLTYLMMDVIPVVTKLNLFFQKEKTDISLVKITTEQCIGSLLKLKSDGVPGVHQNELQNVLVSGADNIVTFHGHRLARCTNEQEVNNACDRFIDSLVNNIRSRFPDTELISSSASEPNTYR